MAAEAIARVQRRASDLGGQIQQLETDTSALLDQLHEVDSVAAGAANTLERYRREVREGKSLSEAEKKNAEGLAQLVSQRGGDPGQNYLRARAPEIQSMMGVAAPSAPPPPTRAAADGPRDLTPEERADYLARRDQKGQPLYTPGQLDRARMLGPGRIFIRPASMAPAGAPPPRQEGGPERHPGPELQQAAPGEPGGPPPRQPSPGEPGGPPPRQPGPDPQPRTQGRGGAGTAPGAGVEGDNAEEARRMAANLDSTDDALLRHAARSRFAAMTERELHEQWKQTNQALREQQRELEQVDSRRAKLERYRNVNGGLSAREEDDLRNELPQRYRDLREGARGLGVERQVLEEMGAANPPGPLSGMGGGVRGTLGAFAGAGGFGGGFPGALAGGALAYATGGASAALGYLGARTVGAAAESYNSRVDFLADLEALGRQTQQDPEAMEAQIKADARRNRVFPVQTLTRATQMLGRGTGQTSLKGTLPVAVLSGMSPEEVAVFQAQMAAIMPEVDPDIALRMLAEFRESGVTRRTAALRTSMPIPGGGPGAPRASATPSSTAPWRTAGDVAARAREWMNAPTPSRMPERDPGPLTRSVRGPDFDPSLIPHFFAAVQQAIAAQQDSPFTGVPAAGVMAQVREASFRDFPGVDPNSPAQARAAGALTQRVNQFASGADGDAFGDMKMLGVLGLRNSETAKRLKNQLGIDISTPMGVMRAMQHAATLAQMEATDPEKNKGFGDVQRGMMGSVRRFMDPETMGLALTMRGMDPESAYQISRPETDDLIGARATRPDIQAFREGADAVTSGGLATRTATRVFESRVEPELIGLDFAQGIDSRAAQTQSAVNEIKSALVDVVREILSAEIGRDVPDE